MSEVFGVMLSLKYNAQSAILQSPVPNVNINILLVRNSTLIHRILWHTNAQNILCVCCVGHRIFGEIVSYHWRTSGEQMWAKATDALRL